MEEICDALVIGAGPAGLATSRALSLAGIAHQVLERGTEVGQTWAHLYDSLVLHTTQAFSTLPGLAFPTGTHRFPTRVEFLNYLRAYARAFEVPVRTAADVVDLRRDEGLWLARTAEGEVVAAQGVVVATGIVSRPMVPALPGCERFSGRVMHSVDYLRADSFHRQRVLVVGAGNSAADIAVDLARAGVDVRMSVRGGLTMVPPLVAGVPIQYLAHLAAPLPRSVQRALTSALARLAGRGSHTSSRSACARMPIVGFHLRDSVRAGAVRVKPAVAELTGSGVRFVDDRTLPVDTLILATGYRAAVGFLNGAVRLDPCGFPERAGRVASADAPGLCFVGHTYDIRGGLYNIGRDAGRAAAAIKSGLDGRRRTPTERRRRHYET